MKLRPQQNESSTQQQTSDEPIRIWEHPWNAHIRKWDAEKHWENELKRPNPPTPESVNKAKFVDKTYSWKTKNR